MSDNVDLKEFLRSRRARLTPEECGLHVATHRRRVPGLRREELAALAGVSVDYYVRLEQGRSVNPSEAVLDAIARALRLDGAEQAHLAALARPTARRRRPTRRPQRVAAATYQLLDTLDDAASPALVLGRRLDVLAANRTARALLGDFDRLPVGQRNYVRYLILDDDARALHTDWATLAAETVAALRLDADRDPDDPALAALVGELSVKSEEFRRWWGDHGVLARTSGAKRYRHPLVGEFTVTYQALQPPGEPDQTLFVYTAAAGSASRDALELLATWDAGTGRTTHSDAHVARSKAR